MNRERRKDINRVRAMIEEAKELLTRIEECEREYYDNMPESIQAGDRGTKAEAAADALQEGIDDLETSLEKLETAAE